MKLSNRKIDLIVKLFMYTFPFFYIVVVSLGTKATEWNSSHLEHILNDMFQTIPNGFFNDFVNYFTSNISDNGIVLLMLYYAFYIVLIEFVLLFKNVLVFMFKVANNLIERGFNND